MEALTLAERGAAKYPDFTDLMDTRGVILYRLGRFEEARKELERCIGKSTRTASSGNSARFHLARLLSEMAESRAAIRLLEECLRERPGIPALGPDERAEAEDLLKRLKAV